MADLSQIKIDDGSAVTYDIKDAVARADIEDMRIYVTPEMFGALGNGINDDSSAIQDAIGTGKTVLFAKEKTYAIAEPITINKSIVIEEGCKIKAIASMNALFEISGATSDTFRFIGGTLDCDSLADYGIYTTSLTGAYIQNVRILNSAVANIYLGSGNHNWVVNCKLYNQRTLTTGIYNNTNDLKVVDCEIYYTSLAIDQRRSILMVSNSHLWSGGTTNASTTSMAIKFSSLGNGVLAKLFLSNVYFDSFYKDIYTSGSTAHIKASSCLFHWASTTTPQNCYGLDVPANSIYKLSSCMFYSDGISVIDILYDGYALAYTEPQTSVASKFTTPQATQTIFNAHVKDGSLHLDFVLKMTSVTADSSTQIPIIVSEGNFPYWIVQRMDGVAYNNTQNTPIPIRLSRSNSTGVTTLHCAEGIAVDDIIQGSIIAPLRG